MQTLGGLTAIGGSVAVLLNSLPLQELDLMRWGIAVARKGGRGRREHTSLSGASA